MVQAATLQPGKVLSPEALEASTRFTSKVWRCILVPWSSVLLLRFQHVGGTHWVCVGQYTHDQSAPAMNPQLPPGESCFASQRSNHGDHIQLAVPTIFKLWRYISCKVDFVLVLTASLDILHHS